MIIFFPQLGQSDLRQVLLSINTIISQSPISTAWPPI